MSVILPNVRKLFIPDKGYMMFDADLAGADAQVVAAEAEDDALLSAFANGLDVHSKNATDMWGERFTKLEGKARYHKRQANKHGVHATNYGAKPMALVRNPVINFTPSEANWFQNTWFTLHPGILTWHQRTQHELQQSRSVSNKFGYRRIYFDRIDGLLPQALAWLPQSTIALTCNKGALQLRRACPWVQILLQVHDSLVFQVPFHRAEQYDLLRRALLVPIPYKRPLVINWGLARSAESWGACEKVKIPAEVAA